MRRNLNEALRVVVANRAQFACEYCRFPDGQSFYRHQIDHIVSLKHGGTSTSDNLAFACAPCNLFKGSDIAALDELGSVVLLFHPRKQAWANHFKLSGAVIEPLSINAQATIRLLRINEVTRVQERLALLQAGHYPRK